VDKAVDDDVAWLHRGVMPITFHDNVFLNLNFGFATRATGGEVREKSLSVFSNGVLRTRKLHKKRRVIKDLVTTLRVEPASVPILSFKLKGLRSRLGSQEVREKEKKLIEVLPMEEQS